MSNIEVVSRPQRIVVGSSTLENGIAVLSRTQRIIVSSAGAISIVNAGPVGPVGPTGGITYATGEQTIPLDMFIINHNLGFFPAAIKFYSLDGEDELEPEEITYVNANQILVIWPEPTAAKWMLS